MSRTLKIYILFLILVLGLIVWVDYSRPKPIDWTPYYQLNKKSPLGLFVLNNELPAMFSKDSLELISNQTIFEYLTPNYRTELIENYNEETYEYTEEYVTYDEFGNEVEAQDSILRSQNTWLYINKNYNIDPSSTKKLLLYIKNGGNALLSCEFFPRNLLDSLGIQQTRKWSVGDSAMFSIKGSKPSFYLTKEFHAGHFTWKDGLKANSLGTFKYKNSQNIYFAEIPFGKGKIWLHLYPVLFTNYELLKDNHYQLTQSTLSILPNQKILWMVKDQTGTFISRHPLRFVKEHAPLRWSWYMGWILLAIFMLFSAKRKQRVVPIIPPVNNTTVDFTKTIGNLYFQEKDHYDLMSKKIQYFLEKVRSEYWMDTTILNEDFSRKLQAKTGKSEEKVQQVIQLIQKHQKQTSATEADLIALNNAINQLLEN
jgi:hypothetical protein